MTVKQDDYEYNWERDEIIVRGVKLKYFATWTHDKNRRQRVYKSEDGKVMKRVPEFFRERLRMKAKMETEESKKYIASEKLLLNQLLEISNIIWVSMNF